MMGKASRRKHQAQPATPSPAGRPRWEGADGFDYAWKLGQSYISAGNDLLGAIDEYNFAKAAGTIAGMIGDRASRQARLLRAAIAEIDPTRDTAQEPPAGAVLPGTFDRWDLDKERERYRPYAESLRALAYGQQEALRRATPVLFDPLSAPELDDDAWKGLRLPFEHVACDFLTALGMSLPVVQRSAGQWVGLVAATLVQQADDVIDVWPVITTLEAAEGDDRQIPRTLLFGRARYGGELPEPPQGLVKRSVDGASVWTMEMDADYDLWVKLWVTAPALAAMTALRLLDAVNVSIQPAELSRPQRRRAAREGSQIPMEVVIRTSRRESAERHQGPIDWQHRWTVRGHWKHFTKGPIFNANPRRRVHDADGNEVVKVWCPPFVKGPDDKPLVLKARRLSLSEGHASQEGS